MGKTFITDETNPNYTADVTNARKLKVETGAALFACISSARSSCDDAVSAVWAGAGYLKHVIIGQRPATATQLAFYDNSGATTGAAWTAFGTSGANVIARLHLDTSADLSGQYNPYPRVIPFNVYCTSGLTVVIGEGSSVAGTILSGTCNDVTVVYQT